MASMGRDARVTNDLLLPAGTYGIPRRNVYCRGGVKLKSAALTLIYRQKQLRFQ